jgi:hypothetical protein
MSTTLLTLPDEILLNIFSWIVYPLQLVQEPNILDNQTRILLYLERRLVLKRLENLSSLVRVCRVFRTFTTPALYSQIDFMYRSPNDIAFRYHFRCLWKLIRTLKINPTLGTYVRYISIDLKHLIPSGSDEEFSAAVWQTIRAEDDPEIATAFLTSQILLKFTPNVKRLTVYGVGRYPRVSFYSSKRLGCFDAKKSFLLSLQNLSSLDLSCEEVQLNVIRPKIPWSIIFGMQSLQSCRLRGFDMNLQPTRMDMAPQLGISNIEHLSISGAPITNATIKPLLYAPKKLRSFSFGMKTGPSMENFNVENFLDALEIHKSSLEVLNLAIDVEPSDMTIGIAGNTVHILDLSKLLSLKELRLQFTISRLSRRVLEEVENVSCITFVEI